MRLPDFLQFKPFNDLKKKMGIERDGASSLPKAMEVDAPPPPPTQARAYVLLKSRKRLDLLDPQPDAWTDEDLAIGLSRTYRWGGHSKHSLTVLALREAIGPLTARESLRELLHDATEALFGGFDPIAPLRPHLGPEFAKLDSRQQAAVDRRYVLPAWSQTSYRPHKYVDRLAAASEAYHVAGWSGDEIETTLSVGLGPLDEDPLWPLAGMQPWEPWPPALAQATFSQRLRQLLIKADVDAALSEVVAAFSNPMPEGEPCHVEL